MGCANQYVGARFVRLKSEQLNQHIASHRHVAERHDQDEPDQFASPCRFLVGNPNIKSEKAEVRIQQRGLKPLVLQHFLTDIENTSVQRRHDRHSEHGQKENAKQDNEKVAHQFSRRKVEPAW